MLVALVTAHWEHGFFAASNGIELPLLYMTAALALDVAGPGRYSLDGLFGLRTHPQAVVAWSAIAIAVVTALAKVAVRRPRPNHVQKWVAATSIHITHVEDNIERNKSNLRM